MARTHMGFNVDTAEGAALAGFLKQLSLEIKTSRHIGPVLRYTHAIMSEEFTDHMTVTAPTQSSRFHHVYEWGQVGDPSAKLWTDKLVGGGNNRIATFQWRASKQVVPVRSDFRQEGVKQVHVFVWKAPVMEYSTGLTIRPSSDKGVLAFFTGPTTPGNKYEMQFTRNPIRVNYPGGKLTTGAFTREYVRWWGGSGAEQVFQRRLRQVLEQDLGRAPIEQTTKAFRRPRTKAFTMQSIADAEAAERAGAAAARKFLQGRSNNYLAMARARERLIYG